MSFKSVLRAALCAGAATAMLVTGVAGTAAAAPAPADSASSISADVLANENTMTVTSSNHAQVLELSKTKLVILDFGATWCGPCKQMKPVLTKLAAEYKGKIMVGFVDVDQQKSLSNQYRVRYLPTLVPMRKGTEIANSRVVGFPGEASLRKWIDTQLAKG